MTNNYYEILEVNKKASPDKIKRAYYKLAKKYHPDINPKTGSLFKNINEAYETLIDPVKRKQYDEFLLNKKESDNTTYAYYWNSEYYDNPEKYPIYTILKDFKKFKFENAIRAIWKRNIFVIFGNSLYFTALSLTILINRLIIKCGGKGIGCHFSRKWPNIFVGEFKRIIKDDEEGERNISVWKYIKYAIFLFTLTCGKLVYHIFNIIYWIFAKVLRYFLIPIAMIISSFIISKRRKQWI